MLRIRTFVAGIVVAVAGLSTVLMGDAATPEAHALLGVNCDAPPVWHCPDTECLGSVVTQQGTVVEMKTRRPFLLDCPAGYKPGDKVNVILSLHGAGSYGNWQRNYFPAFDVKDKYKLVIITPNAPTRFWTEADDDYLHNLVDLVVGTVGKKNVDHFILAGHSQGGMTSNRIICTDYFKDKVDVRISLSGGRVGDATPAGRGFGAGGPMVYLSGQPYTPPAPFHFPPQPPGPPGGACDYSFIFSTGEYEVVPAATSPLAEKFACGARVQMDDVLDPKAGYVWDATRQDPGTDGWGHYPKSGRAQVFVFPKCHDGRVIADVIRMQKGHTEGYEPNITDRIIALAVSAKGGKIASGNWEPPAPPPPPRGPFG